MDEEAINRGGKIPTFDGQIRNFPACWKKFSAHSTMARIKSVLKEETYIHLPRKNVSEIDVNEEKGKLV
jgi:hypothetical protein